MSGQWASYWREAIDKELAGLIAIRTWDLIPATSVPRGSNLMNCHYVFDVKRLRDGTVDKFKARLVADGNTQKYGVDYDRIFATVVKTSTICLALIVAATRDYNLTQIDIRQAYLQAELPEYTSTCVCQLPESRRSTRSVSLSCAASTALCMD